MQIHLGSDPHRNFRKLALEVDESQVPDSLDVISKTHALVVASEELSLLLGDTA